MRTCSAKVSARKEDSSDVINTHQQLSFTELGQFQLLQREGAVGLSQSVLWLILGRVLQDQRLCGFGDRWHRRQ